MRGPAATQATAGRRRTSWLFTSMTEDLNYQGGTSTRRLRITSPALWPLDHAASSECTCMFHINLGWQSLRCRLNSLPLHIKFRLWRRLGRHRLLKIKIIKKSQIWFCINLKVISIVWKDGKKRFHLFGHSLLFWLPIKRTRCTSYLFTYVKLQSAVHHLLKYISKDFRNVYFHIDSLNCLSGFMVRDRVRSATGQINR